MRIQVWSLTSLTELMIWCCCKLQQRSQMQLRPVLPWLWHRPAAAAPTATLAPGKFHMLCVWPKKKKKKKNAVVLLWCSRLRTWHCQKLGLLLWVRFDLWPRKFHMPQAWPKQNKKKWETTSVWILQIPASRLYCPYSSALGFFCMPFKFLFRI